jgi:chromosomal replication initiator protein
MIYQSLDRIPELYYYCGQLIPTSSATLSGLSVNKLPLNFMETEKLWKSVLAELELSVSKATYQTHFAHSSLVSLVDNVATVGFSNPLMRTLVETRYYSLVKSILDHHTNQNISLVFVIVPKKETLSQKDAGPLFAPQEEPTLTMASIARRLHIRPDFTFENFAVSTTNQMAYAAATAVAKSPGTAYNPLFIYGGVGVGKTHLMHAVANAVLARKPNAPVVYCMGEEFLNEIIEAIQTKTARRFKQKYRSAQLLLVDDVQFIAGKQTAQEEFFHTFNAVHREGGQIILISDRPPGEISKLENRLRSRFEGGLTVDISPPDFELRVAIINIKSAALGVSVPPDAARLIAANIADTRAIEGFLRRIATEAAARTAPVSAELVSSLLSIKAPAGEGQKQTKSVPPGDILDAVARCFNIKTTAIKGPKRDRALARPRQVFMYICRTELGLTLEDIGGALGGRDHTTIMHGVEVITKEMSTNEGLRDAVSGIKQKLWA